jgi:DNA-binding beta-propeller fold protein YncE
MSWTRALGAGLAATALLTAFLPAGAASSSPIPGSGPVPGEVLPGSTGLCTTKVASAPRLSGVRTALVAAHGYPFGLATASRGNRAFVTVFASSGAATIGIYRTRSFVPWLIRSLRLPDADAAVGDTLTRNGKYLLGATNNGLVVISVARAERGSKHAILGRLSAPGGQGGIEVAVSRDGRYAFVSLEYSFDLAVFNLHRALTRGFSRSDLVGTIPTGAAPVGLAVSPSGRYLYSTSEVARHGRTQQGTLSVISVRRAERDPARSVISTVDSGCGTVRVVTSRSGSVVWVTARESDALLAFSAARLRRHPRHARLADVRVGEAPVGLALVDGGRRIVVADSNRFQVHGEQASLAVVSVAAALHHRPAVLGYLRAGLFPRQMALEPCGRTLLVGNFESKQLEAVDVARLP